MLDDPAERERRRSDGLACAANFTWPRAAELTYEIYRSVLER
jgi:hypothetical protein